MRTLILTWLAVAALAGAGLLWHHALWPFSRRPGRPFSRAAREIGAFSGESDEILKRHLLALHRAIDETVGERVLASDLGQFTHAHQNFAGSSSALARFFESSRHAFFRNDLAAARRTLSERDIADLAETLQRQERGGR